MSTSTPIQELPFQKGLKAFLARTGRTQASLAQSIFVAQSSLNNWCRGKGDPSVTVALLALEGMTLEEMFGKEIADKLVANSRDCSNEVVRKVAETIAPKPQKPKKQEIRKTGFISKLAAMFSAKG